MSEESWVVLCGLLIGQVLGFALVPVFSALFRALMNWVKRR